MENRDQVYQYPDSILAFLPSLRFDCFASSPKPDGASVEIAPLYSDKGRQTKALDIPLDKGPRVCEAKHGKPLKVVKSYTEQVRGEIDWS